MLFAAQLSVDCFGICGTSCVLKRSHWICKSIAASRRMFVAVDLETSGLRPRQDSYVQHVPQYTSGSHESVCEGGQTRMASILVVDEAHSLRRALEALLSREGYTVLTAASGDEALAHLEQHEVDVLLCDVSMPTMDSLAVLRHVQAHDAGIAAVMMSGHGDITTAVAAMKEGAYDCLVKPISCEDLLRTVQKALAMRALYIENLVLKRQVYDQFARANVLGSSPAWQRVCQMVKQVAPSPATVLLTGESG